MSKTLVILGAGEYGRTIFDIAEQLGFEIVMLDDKIVNYPLSSFVKYVNTNTEFIPAFGSNKLRMEWINRIEENGGKIAVLIHPTAYISPKASVEAGTVVLPGAIINTGTIISRGCIINLGVVIDHDCIIEEGVHVCDGAIIKGNNRITRCEKIEAGVIIERNARK